MEQIDEKILNLMICSMKGGMAEDVRSQVYKYFEDPQNIRKALRLFMEIIGMDNNHKFEPRDICGDRSCKKCSISSYRYGCPFTWISDSYNQIAYDHEYVVYITESIDSNPMSLFRSKNRSECVEFAQKSPDSWIEEEWVDY